MQKTWTRTVAAALTACSLLTPAQGFAAACLTGVNLAGANFGEGPAKHGTTHIYPTTETLDYFQNLGVNIIRLPFQWERLQPTLSGPLDPTELALLDDTVRRTTARGMKIIIDPHNFAKFKEVMIGSGNVTIEDFADFWKRVAKLYANDPDVIFLLTNEPDRIDPKLWWKAANAGIAAIRSAGAGNLIMVPGNLWTGAVHWFDDQDGVTNAELALGVEDPLSHYVFDIHQYMDSDFSGMHVVCERVDDALGYMQNMTDWLRKNGHSAFLGEFGGSIDPSCMTGLKRITDHMAQNADVWLGWSAWAAGEWWGDYMYTLQPLNGVDRAQIVTLKPHFEVPEAERTCGPLHVPVRP